MCDLVVVGLGCWKHSLKKGHRIKLGEGDKFRLGRIEFKLSVSGESSLSSVPL